MNQTPIVKLCYVSLFAALTAIGGFISVPIPFSPVPITLQITFTAMAGLVLGSRYGALSQLIYLLLGALGLPVFSNRTGGFAMLYGPTAGFLWGFVICAFVIGLIQEKRKFTQPGAIFLTQVIGLIITYFCGVIGLMLVLKFNALQAFSTGVAPFILLDTIKLVIATLLVIRLQKAKIGI
ncbi:MAG: biotin transporter BioY [Firmicutes bacterium]|nr:biotin transporter BioY [Bacillota bacterium]